MPRTAPRQRFCALSVAVFALFSAPAADAALTCELLPKFINTYLENHVRFRQLSPEIEARTIDSYLRRIDPSRSMLLESQVESLRVSLKGIFDSIRAGDCSRLPKVHALMVARHAGTEEFVRAIVDREGYEIDESVSLILDPDDRGHPKTVREREDLLLALIHFQMSNYVAAETAMAEAKKKLVHRYELRTERFSNLDDADLYGQFLDTFAASLDPHSNYLSAETLEDFRISMSLSLEGIGVALSERDGYAVVERIIPGGAAARIDVLQPKDKIIAVAQDKGEAVNIIDMPLRDAVAIIRGKKGTTVRLTVLRQGDKIERFPVAIVRDKIDLEEQAASLRFVDQKVGDETLRLAVLELPSFYGDADPSKRQSTDDVAKLLRQVREEKADGLLLDLSGNGGGLLEHAVTISGFFLRKGEIVGIQNPQGQNHILPDRDEGILFSGPMVVHTSRVSASAAEILAGALKDYKRAVIAGDDHTFGKGTVQTVSSLLPGQGALKITTALFFRPGGKSTQHDGVAADVVVPSVLSGDDFGEKHQRYSLPGQQIEPFLSSYANAVPPSGRWRPVTPEVVRELQQRSSARVASSEAFAEIFAKIAEARESDGVIHLAEFMKEQKANADGDGDSDGDTDAAGVVGVGAMTKPPGDRGDADKKISPQLEEATEVLRDLILVSR
jgi:carboxyl-terminal processing protease